MTQFYEILSAIGDLVKRLHTAIFAVVLAGSMTSCGLDTDEVINDLNNQLEDEGEIYYDPSCDDVDQDGWCD